MQLFILQATRTSKRDKTWRDQLECWQGFTASSGYRQDEPACAPQITPSAPAPQIPPSLQLRCSNQMSIFTEISQRDCRQNRRRLDTLHPGQWLTVKQKSADTVSERALVEVDVGEELMTIPRRSNPLRRQIQILISAWMRPEQVPKWDGGKKRMGRGRKRRKRPTNASINLDKTFPLDDILLHNALDMVVA